MLIEPLSYDYIKAFSFYEKGFMPNGESWLNESHKFIQAMTFLSNLFNKAGQETNAKHKPRHTH